MALSAALLAAPAFADRALTPRFSVNEKGDILHTGNTLMTCPSSHANCAGAQNGTETGGFANNNAYSMVYVDVDSDASTFNSSTANLALPAGAEVLFAGLYYSGNTAAGGEAARATTLVDTPAAGGYVTVTANQIDDFNSSDINQHIYGGFADITSLVSAGGAGNYTVANVQAATGLDHHAGWGIVVAFKSNDESPRNMTIFDGIIGINPNEPDENLTLSGFQTSPTGTVNADFGFIVWEGDKGLTGDQVLFEGLPLSDGNNPATNFNNSTISIEGTHFANKTPNHQNQLGYDNDLLNADGLLTNNQTSADLTLRTTGDRWVPQVITFAPDVYSPDIDLDKTAVDVNGGLLLPGDVVEYRITGTNIGQETADDVVVTDPIPAGSTYVPGSLNQVAGANSGAKTDGSGDDQAEFDSGGGLTRFRVGTGANGSQGGLVAQNEGFEVRFRVRINTGTPGGTTITNVATADYQGEQTGIDYSVDTDPVPVTTDLRPEISLDKTGPAAAAHGTNINYTYAATNPGEAPLSNVTLTDPGCSPISAPTRTGGDQDALLEPGETWTYTCSTPVPAHSGGEQDPISSTATVNGTFGGATVNDTDAHPVDLLHPAINVDKTGPASAAHGDTMTFTYALTNAGDAPLTSVGVSDNLCSPVSAPAKTGGDQDNDLEGAETWTYTCQRAVPAHTGAEADPFVNTATAVGSAGGVQVTDTDQHSTDVTHPNDADLAIDKSGPATVAAGGRVTYTLNVSNGGPGSTTGVVVTDTLPAGTTFVAAASSPGCSAAGQIVTCTAATLANAASVSFTVAADTALGQAGTTITNAATVRHDGDDPNPANDSDQANTAVGTAADLSLTKTAPGTAQTGNQLTFTLVVANGGPSTATGVTVTDQLPAGLGFVSANPSQGSCSQSAGTVTCALGTINSGAGAQVAITTTVGNQLAGTTITNTASVTSPVTDPDPSDNSDDAQVNVVSGSGARADLGVVKTITNGNARVGSNLTYRITVTNQGPDPATDVDVVDTLNQSVTLVSANTQRGTCSSSLPLSCSLGRLTSGESVAITVVVRLEQPGRLVNTASATSPETDPNLANNSDNAIANVDFTRTTATLKKAANKKKIGPSERFAYTITFTNTGAAAAANVEICDDLPKHTIFVSAPDGATYDGAARRVCWKRDSVGPGATLVLTLNVKATKKLPRKRKLRNLVTATGSNFSEAKAASYINCGRTINQ